ncbi:MAG: hypothetical protein EA391_07600 [Balneolaceae bacterium]|nr:MAG: hypothetical protein EA391_07600 [Balneolaceae bacterium]
MIVKSPPIATDRGISGGRVAKNKRRTITSKKLNTDGAAPTHGRRTPTTKKTKLPAFTPWKVILVSFLIGICGILYIAHVFNTQQVLTEVNQLESEFNKAQRQYHQTRLEFDRLTGPQQIYSIARQHGFVNAGPADQIIYIQAEAK